jgi:UDP-N-acetylglucosamine--N-acetylmuramyl-(pentapeptide) pyrophosphoryl-undecaprenol N-acetylglucosamine transferase
MSRHRIVLSGGGTGGHIYPALALAEQLRSDSDVEAILYIGASGHLEDRLTKERNLEFVGLSVSGLPRKISPKAFLWPFETISAVATAWRVLQSFRPTAVIGTGGYASAPPLIAAALLGIPYAIHEPDSFPGKVNMLLARRASFCSLGMEAARERLLPLCSKLYFNGNPIRSDFFQLPSRAEAAHRFGLDPSIPTLLVTGGSQGAQAVNSAVQTALPRLLHNDLPLQILHQVGDKNFDEYKETLASEFVGHPRYKMIPYIDNLATAYALCDLSVCRAGAMTIAELAATGKPAILVPYPIAAQDHQMHNGRYLESQGCAVVIPQSRLTGEALGESVLSMFLNPSRLKEMSIAAAKLAKPNAAKDLATQLKALR